MEVVEPESETESELLAVKTANLVVVSAAAAAASSVHKSASSGRLEVARLLVVES